MPFFLSVEMMPRQHFQTLWLNYYNFLIVSKHLCPIHSKQNNHKNLHIIIANDKKRPGGESMSLIPPFIFACSVNIDAFLVGMSYGLRRLRITPLQNFFISFILISHRSFVKRFKLWCVISKYHR